MRNRLLWLATVALIGWAAPAAFAAHAGGHAGHHGGSSATGSAAGTSGTGSSAAPGAAAGVAGGDPGGTGGTRAGAAKSVVAIPAPSVMNKGGGLPPGSGHADTQIPYGSTDTADQGGPGLGGMGGSSMQVSDYGKKSWPCYPAGQWAGSPDFKPPAGCPK